MKSKSLRILLAMTAVIIGLSAFGCGGIPMPEEEGKYSTWVERVRFPDKEDLDVVHVSFDIEFDKTYYNPEKQERVLIKKDELQGYFDDCSVDGACGVTAQLKADGAYKHVSSSCKFKDIEGKEEDDGNDYKIKTDCSVPILGGMQKGNTYRLKLATVSPDLSKKDPAETEHVYPNGDDGSISPKHNLVFTSSPGFEVTETKLKALSGVLVQQQ